MLKAQSIRGKDDVDDDDEGVVNGEEDRIELSEPDRDGKQCVKTIKKIQCQKGTGTQTSSVYV